MHERETYLDLSVPRTTLAPWHFRQSLDALYRDIPRSALPTARLLVSELASNGVRHGRGETIDVKVERRGEVLRVAVTDGGDGFRPRPQDHRDDGGWGLELVEMLSSAWGVEKGSTVVWFELPLDGRA